MTDACMLAAKRMPIGGFQGAPWARSVPPLSAGGGEASAVAIERG